MPPKYYYFIEDLDITSDNIPDGVLVRQCKINIKKNFIIYNKNIFISHEHLKTMINEIIDVNDKKIMEPIQMGNRSFPYEDENLDYNNHLVSKIVKLKEKFVDPYNFENPTHIDIIQFLDEPIENSPILHFKS